MYSNTQNALRAPSTTWRLRMPSSPMLTSSPGCTSRRWRAPMMSNAHDSLATQ